MRSRGSTKVFALLRDMVRVVRRGRASGRTATDGDNDGTTAKDHLSAQYDQHQRLRKQSMARGCASRRFSNASSRLRMTKAEPFPGSSSGFIAIGWSSKQGEPLSSVGLWSFKIMFFDTSAAFSLLLRLLLRWLCFQSMCCYATCDRLFYAFPFLHFSRLDVVMISLDFAKYRH
jgi:hypothetical protein